MLEVRDLELVDAILSHGNFARAARALGLGQPVLSRRLADLEHRLGGPLFLRHHFRAEPTDLCRSLSTEAEGILERVRGLERRLAGTRGQQASDLRIAAGGFAAETSVLAAAGLMMAQLPKVRVSVASRNWMDVLHTVREREAELGVLELTALEEGTTDFIVEPLLRHPAFLAVRAGHPLAERPGLTLPEILRFPLVFIGKVPTRIVGPFAAAREAALAAGSAHPAFPALIHESPSAALLALQGSDAVVVVTAPIARRALRAQDLALLPWHEPWATTGFGIIQTRGQRLSRAATAFVALLRDADARAFEDGAAMLTGLHDRIGAIASGPVPAASA